MEVGIIVQFHFPDLDPLSFSLSFPIFDGSLNARLVGLARLVGYGIMLGYV